MDVSLRFKFSIFQAVDLQGYYVSNIPVFTVGMLFLLYYENTTVSKAVIHKSVKDFVYLMAAQSGISIEQASITMKSIMTYMQQYPTHPLQKAIAAIFGTKKNDNDTLLN